MHCLSSLGGIKGHFVKNDRKFVVDVDFFFLLFWVNFIWISLLMVSHMLTVEYEIGPFYTSWFCLLR